MFTKLVLVLLLSLLCHSEIIQDTSKGEQALTQAYSFRGKTHDQIDCSHLVWEGFKKAGYSYTYAPTASLPSSTAFEKISLSQARRGDILLFDGHMAFIEDCQYSGGVLSGTMFGSQTSTGPASTSFNKKKGDYWGNTKKIIGVYPKK